MFTENIPLFIRNIIRELNKSLKKIECEVDLDADEYTFTEDGYGKSELDLIITKGLTEEEKNRFYKYFLHGYSISELAQLEKISENNMSVRISTHTRGFSASFAEYDASV